MTCAASRIISGTPIFSEEVHVFARIVSMRLKPNSTAEFTQTIEKRILPILRRQKGFGDEITLVRGGTEAIGISFWDTREQADAYDNSGGYALLLKELTNLLEGTLRVRSYDVVNSTVHKIAARSASLFEAWGPRCSKTGSASATDVSDDSLPDFGGALRAFKV